MNTRSKQKEVAPWSVPADIMKPKANKKIRELGKNARRLENKRARKLEKKKKIRELFADIAYLFLN